MRRNLPALHVVADTPATRAASLMTQAKQAAREHTEEILRLAEALESALTQVCGDAYPAGVRDASPRWAADLSTRRDHIKTVMGRAP